MYFIREFVWRIEYCDFRPVRASVPQGSVLGSILYTDDTADLTIQMADLEAPKSTKTHDEKTIKLLPRLNSQTTVDFAHKIKPKKPSIFQYFQISLQISSIPKISFHTPITFHPIHSSNNPRP